MTLLMENSQIIESGSTPLRKTLRFSGAADEPPHATHSGKGDTVRLRTDVALVPGGVKASICNGNQWACPLSTVAY
nr:hypothetical protein BN993_04940 [Virgibacillus halodenitrificans]